MVYNLNIIILLSLGNIEINTRLLPTFAITITIETIEFKRKKLKQDGFK